MEVALDRLVTWLPRLQLAQDPVRPPRFVLRGFNSHEMAIA